jgi:hypothetical protein
MPRCNTEAMNLHLAEIATQIAPGAHAVLLVDQAGWASVGQAHRAIQHHADPVPGKVPRAEPAGKHLAILARQLLSNRIFKSFHDTVDHCCDAWNKLINQPWRIMSIGLRDWAYRS